MAHEIYLEPAQIEKTYILKIKAPGGVVDEAYTENVMDKVIEYIKKIEGGHEN